MDRKTKWRTFWLAALALFAVLTLVPSVTSSRSVPVWFSKLFNKKVQLGLDLQGGLHIVYSINLKKAVEDKASELKRDIEAKLEDAKPKPIAGKVVMPSKVQGGVTIILEDAADKDRVQGKFLSDYDEIITKRSCPPEQESNSVCLRVSSDYADRIKKSALEQAIRTVRERIDERGIAEPTVISKGDQIIVELPGLDEEEIERVKSLIKRTARLEFKMVVNSSEYMQSLYAFVADDAEAARLGIKEEIDQWRHDESGKQFQDYYLTAKDETRSFTIAAAKERGCWNKNKSEIAGKVDCNVTGKSIIADYVYALSASNPDLVIDEAHQFGFEYVTPQSGAKKKRDPYWRSYYLAKTVELGGSAVAAANVFWNPTTNAPEVLVEFNRWGGRRFGDMTASHIGHKMAIILDEKVNSAPVIQGAIRGGRSTITMGGSDAMAIQAEAQDLVDVLRTGSLPAPLVEESSSIIGPLLGRDAIKKTQFSFMLGSLLVIVIMIFIYRLSGIISILALVLNLTFMMGALAGLGAVLTLPGIAALVLTVGMAVDANIIIYERIREELRLNKSVRGAVDAGFSRGFAAILDGQCTTAVAAYVLMQYGSGPIRGFAVMLLIGIGCTLFTTTWCSRLFFEHYIGRGRKAATISI